MLKLPLSLPDDAVVCVGVCDINYDSAMTVTAVAPARFVLGLPEHGATVTVAPGGQDAVWPRGAAGCNQIAAIAPNSTDVANPSFTVELQGAGGSSSTLP